MNKLKNYTIIALLGMLLALAGALKIVKDDRDKERADNARLSLNQERLLDDSLKNVEITLTREEWLKQKSDSIKELEKALRIKPKTVIQYVERTLTDELPVPKIIPVSMIGKNTWQISDSSKCFTWKGVARLSGESLIVTRTYFGYENTMQDFLHREKKGRFIFWDTYYKNRFTLTSVTECGYSRSKTINITK